MSLTTKIPDWEEKYLIGIHDIDFQHRYFLGLIKRFDQIINATSDKHLIVNHINEIILYAQFHFCSEENIMKLNGYPDLENHKKLHQEIIRVLSNKITLHEMKAASVEEITSHMIDWFLEHTLESDIEIARYINNQ